MTNSSDIMGRRFSKNEGSVFLNSIFIFIFSREIYDETLPEFAVFECGKALPRRLFLDSLTHVNSKNEALEYAR